MSAEKLLYMLTPKRLREVGAITVLVGSIEFQLERALWALEGELVAGQKPSTDTKPVSLLIDNLSTVVERIADPELKRVVKLWTQIAKPAFKCRNCILHGLAIIYSKSIAEFITNTRWEGEIRKRDSSSFHVNEYTLALLSSVFQNLLNSIIAIKEVVEGKIKLSSFFTKDYVAAMTNHRSLANEIVDLAGAVNHEKY